MATCNCICALYIGNLALESISIKTALMKPIENAMLKQQLPIEATCPYSSLHTASVPSLSHRNHISKRKAPIPQALAVFRSASILMGALY